MPSVAAQPVGEFSVFSDKIAVLPISTKMSTLLAVLSESHHSLIAVVDEHGSLVAEFKPHYIKAINSATYFFMTLDVGEYLTQIGKMQRPPVAVPSTRFEEVLRLMVVEGRESVWVVDERSSYVPLGTLDALNILRYLCMRIQKKPASFFFWNSLFCFALICSFFSSSLELGGTRPK